MSLELEGRIAELERRVARQDDIEAIRRLKAEHALASDDHEHLAERLLAIVTDDIELDYRPVFGHHKGIDQLRKLLTDTPFPWTLHYMICKRIDIAADGESATGVWYLWEPATAPDPRTGEERAVWLGGVYEDTYRKQPDGQWKIAKMKLATQLLSPYERGWAKERITDLTAGAWTD